MIRIATAGWSIPRTVADRFPTEGTGLERYATLFPATEINSSFHRPHRLTTWERWRDSVPAGFRFSVKLPKTVTHVRKLVDSDDDLAPFLDQAHALGDKLAVLLVQLPPKLDFDRDVAAQFFSLLKSTTTAAIACEPRHPSWFEPSADDLLARLEVARVAADPAVGGAAAAIPGGWPGLRYWRFHGSPVVYRSSYGDRIGAIASSVRQFDTGESWCIFDNTASSAAGEDALGLTTALDQPAAGESMP